VSERKKSTNLTGDEIMKSFKLLAGATLLAVSLASFAYTPGAGITGTKHDWSGASATTLLQWLDSKGAITTYNTGNPYIDPATGQQGTTKVTIGQCTKCHTPHQAKSVNLLWNHTLQATAYAWDAPATTAGTAYAQFTGDTYKGPTTKCLSCHDGLLASTDGMWFNRQSVSGSKYVAPPGSLNSGHEVAEGANMSKSHPVAMPYPINGGSNQYNFVTNGAQIAPTEWVADPMATNKLKLYNDDGAGNIVAGVVAGKSGIECSSCHDVHNGARTKDVLLLTGLLTGSDRSPGGYICTQCHLK
jgi:nitrate reductase cytochrome c-type subunit